MTSKRLYQRKPCKPFWDVVRANCIDSTGEACSHGAAPQINTLGSYGTWTQRSRKSPKKLRCRKSSQRNGPKRSSDCTPRSSSRQKNTIQNWKKRQGTPRSQCTRLGVLAGRYVDDHFGMDDGSIAIFHRSDIGRKTLYHVSLEANGADV